MLCVLDSVVHEIRRLVDSKGADKDYTLVYVDAHNTFNRLSRRRMTDLLPTQVLSSSRFLNMVYAHHMPSVIPQAASKQEILSQERMQLRDLGTMLMFSLVVHPLATEIAERTQSH